MALPFFLLILSFVGDLEQGNLGNIFNFPTFLSEGKRLLACFFKNIYIYFPNGGVRMEKVEWQQRQPIFPGLFFHVLRERNNAGCISTVCVSKPQRGRVLGRPT